MNLSKPLKILAFCLAASTSYAGPGHFVTHNLTQYESNAYIAGKIPSPTPTKANSTAQVPWTLVRLACFGHTDNNKCTALIKMATNTKNPVELGQVTLDLETGDIEPKRLSAHGFTFTVNGLAEVTLTE